MTIKDIADLAGVSTSTVSKIMNNKDEHINPATRQHVLEIVKKYNYTPYGAVKSAFSGKTMRIGVLLSSLSKRLSILTGIMQAAQAHGYVILPLDSRENTETELLHVSTLCSHGVDGVIWDPVSDVSMGFAQYFSKQQIPYLLINHPLITGSYYIDFAALAYRLTEKLLEYRHANIACVLSEDPKRSSLFLEGFQKCLYDHHILYTDKMLVYASGENILPQLFTGAFTGAVCSHFDTALQIYDLAYKLHCSIPDSLSLVTLQNDTAQENTHFRVSGIRIPYLEFGSYICEHIIGIFEKNPAEPAKQPFVTDTGFDTMDSVHIPPVLCGKRLISVGSINMDITFNVDCLPESGKSSTVLGAFTSAGGKGANQAIGASRLGHEVVLIGKTGNDADSSAILQLFEKENINTQGILRDSLHQTGKAYIYTESDGESAITILSGANDHLHPKDILEKQHLFQNASFCMISTEIPLASVEEAARLSKKLHVKTILKPAVLKQIPASLLSLIDIFVPNKKEAAALCPDCQTIEKQAEYFFQAGVPIVIITLGHKGCYLKSKDAQKYFPAVEFPAIDTTGGADAFISALASFLCDGYALESAIQIAIYAAAFCITRKGVVSSLVDKDSLWNYIQQKQPELLLKDVD